MPEGPTYEGLGLLDQSQTPSRVPLVNHNNLLDRTAQAGDVSYKFLPYQFLTVG